MTSTFCAIGEATGVVDSLGVVVIIVLRTMTSMRSPTRGARHVAYNGSFEGVEEFSSSQYLVRVTSEATEYVVFLRHMRLCDYSLCTPF